LSGLRCSLCLSETELHKGLDLRAIFGVLNLLFFLIRLDLWKTLCLGFREIFGVLSPSPFFFLIRRDLWKTFCLDFRGCFWAFCPPSALSGMLEIDVCSCFHQPNNSLEQLLNVQTQSTWCTLQTIFQIVSVAVNEGKTINGR